MPFETITVDAVKQNLDSLTDKIETMLSDAACPMPLISKILVSVDEIFNNICSYAYKNGEKGKICIDLDVSAENKQISIVFKDKGVPYDPLSHKDPDTTLPAEERPIGGLGIFLVKKLMDKVEYQYINNENTLKIQKSW